MESASFAAGKMVPSGFELTISCTRLLCRTETKPFSVIQYTPAASHIHPPAILVQPNQTNPPKKSYVGAVYNYNSAIRQDGRTLTTIDCRRILQECSFSLSAKFLLWYERPDSRVPVFFASNRCRDPRNAKFTPRISARAGSDLGESSKLNWGARDPIRE
ncbi:hypothetical protein BCV70DRAFT_21253 [Testicularia cyperi]|uniref:Uncharacterized protein n=1 Tax=Testicularia cyperi TaxID=1882483 RepID=A0A317XZG8_9BASI|nr:hypothetical protein BCV70DRAFT_21253 [Testicularia cyperi]